MTRLRTARTGLGADYRGTIAAIRRLAEPGTFALEEGRYFDWRARAAIRGEKLETWTPYYCAKTIGAALRTLLRELRKQQAQLRRLEREGRRG